MVVLFERVHLLPKWLELVDRAQALIGGRVGRVIHDAASLRTANHRLDEVQADVNGLTFSPVPMRTRFVLRLGRN